MQRRVNIIGKPLSPPWNDSSKNLARDLVAHGERYRYRVTTSSGAPPLAGPVDSIALRFHTPALAPTLAGRAQVLLHALIARDVAVQHCFFAPSALSARVLTGLKSVRRREPVVHTLCSLPASNVSLAQVCVADISVVLSAHARDMLQRAGVRGVRHVDPCVPLGALPTEQERSAARSALGLRDRPTLVFAGDLEEGHGALAFVQAMARIVRHVPSVQFVLAWRHKNPHTAMRAREFMALLRGGGLLTHTHALGEIVRMDVLHRAADVHILPARSLYKKMDYPLVILEGFSHGVPAIVGSAPSLLELARLPGGPALALEDDSPEAIATAALSILDSPARRTTMALAARDAAATRFAPARMAAEYERIYDELLEH